MSFSLTRGTSIVQCGGKVVNSSISQSTIDMNGGIITSHAQPVNPTDVANKAYVDTIMSILVINLTSTNYTTVLPITSGTISVFVKNIIPNGPSGSFQLSKSESDVQPSYTRLSSSAGKVSKERLDMRWEPGQGIQLKKTGTNYDGQYRIRYLLID